MQRRTITHLIAGVLLPITAAWAAFEDIVPLIKQDTEWLASFANRTPGTREHARMLDELQARVSAVPGVEVSVQEFETLMPRVDAASLTVAEGDLAGVHKLYPIWPALARLNTTPAGGISGKLVYVGNCDLRDLPATSLRGCIAVAEMRKCHNWKWAFSLGARAIILLGGGDEKIHDAHAHLGTQPVYYPRYFVPQSALADALRNGTVPNGRIDCRGAWDQAACRNIYALINPSDLTAPQRAIAIVAPIDSVSVVQGLAPGADAAVDAAFALAMLRRLAESTPPRPVLFAFLDAQSVNQLGIRQMLASFAALPDERKNFIEDYQEVRDKYIEHSDLGKELEDSGDVFKRLHRRQYKELHRYVKDILSPELNVLEQTVPDLRLVLHKAEGKEGPELDAMVEELFGVGLGELLARFPALPAEVREGNAVTPVRIETALDELQERRNLLMGTQNKIMYGLPFTERTGALAQEIWGTLTSQIDRQIACSSAPLDDYRSHNKRRTALRESLGLDEDTQRPIAFVFGVDLSDAGFAVGPRLYCEHLRHYESANAKEFRDWLKAVADTDGSKLWEEEERKAVNLLPFFGQDSLASFMTGRVATLTSPAQSFATPAVTWSTLSGYRERVDTVRDRADLLDWNRLSPQIAATARLVDAMVTDGDFTLPDKGGHNKWRRAWGTVVDTSLGDPVPRVPQEGYVTTMVLRWAYRRPSAGLRQFEFAKTGPAGQFRFEALPATIHRSRMGFAVHSFHMTEDGRIVRAVTDRASSSGLNRNVDLGHENPGAVRALVFDCVELCPAPFWDPGFMVPLNQVTLLDAMKATAPRFISTTVVDGQVCSFVPPEIRWQAIVRSGSTVNRMLMLNYEPDEKIEDIRDAAKGFALNRRVTNIPEHVSARDFWYVNARRLKSFRRAGIRSEAIDRVHARSAELLKEVDSALAKDSAADLVDAASAALSSEVRAYQAVRNTANDVARAAIILLLGLLPFAVAMERLLFASPHIYRQIAVSGLIFTVMTSILWSFHPAFRITNQPLIIILAFIILFMSMMVIYLIMHRFQADLDRIRSGRAEGSGATTARAGLLMCALTIGIANMRKRKLRTSLTGATIALITFALLCFTSAKSYQDHHELDLDVKAEYRGLLLRQPAFRGFRGEVLERVRNMMGDDRICVPRYWWTGWQGDFDWRVYAIDPRTGEQESFRAAVLLDENEDRLSRIRDVAPDWETFQAGRGCYMAAQKAEQLGVKSGDKVVVGGIELDLIGTYDPGQFIQRVKTLDGQPIVPFDFSSLSEGEQQTIRNQSIEMATDEMASGMTFEPDFEMDFLDPDEVLLLPVTKFEHVASLRSIGVPIQDGGEVAQAGIKLIERLAYPVYYGAGRNVRVLASAPLIPKAPRSMLIPLLVAAMIIFNTMMNSIAERKGEIHIYTSLGLAPGHVGVLFLAEAVTYGLMGSIFGFVVGQAFARLASNLGWMGGITLNYSGTHVVMTMALVMAVVVMSAIVPALMAAKMATPGEDINWRVPRPVNGVIEDILPFTVTPVAAHGIVGYLHDFFEAHREGSIGNFATDGIRVIPGDGDGVDNMGVESIVWVAPYDLGVRQHVRVLVRSTEDEDICEIHIELRHEAGQEKDWWKLNRTFIGDLRRQLLGWRRVEESRVIAYIVQAGEMLGKTIPGFAMPPATPETAEVI